MLDLRFFNFCAMQKCSVLGLVCKECQYLVGTEGDYRCGYQETDKPGEYVIKGIIIRLLERLEEGQLNISEAELLTLLEGE